MSRSTITLAAFAAFAVLGLSANAEDRSLPYGESKSATVRGVPISFSFRLQEDSHGDAILTTNFSSPFAGSGRTVDVTDGVNPAVGKCFQVSDEVPTMQLPMKSYWFEACSSGFHCRGGRKWVSVAIHFKIGFHGGIPTQTATLMSGDWYRSKNSC